MSRRKHDYDSLKRQYVTGSMSIRELCRMNGISAWSSVSNIAKSEGWEELREAYAREVQSRALTKMAETESEKIARIRLDALDVIHAGILKMGSDMEQREPILINGELFRDESGQIVTRPSIVYRPGELATLIDKLQTLTGQPSQIHEERKLGLDFSAATDEGTLRELLGRLRNRESVPRGSGPSEELGAPRTRPN